MNWFKKKPRELIVLSPADGEVIPTSKVSDEVFSKDMMGVGVAIIPSDGKFVAPISGKLVTVFPTKHAYGIETKEGHSVLLHIGVDTVKLNGEGFESFVVQDAKVQAGDSLVNVNLKTLAQHKVSTQSPIIVTNDSMGDAKLEILVSKGKVTKGTPLYKLTW